MCEVVVNVQRMLGDQGPCHGQADQSTLVYEGIRFIQQLTCLSLSLLLKNNNKKKTRCSLFPLQSRKASEPDKEKKGLEGRADSIGSGRAIPIKQVGSSPAVCTAIIGVQGRYIVSQGGLWSGLRPTLGPFEAVSLINGKSVHLTSVRAGISCLSKQDH